MTTVKQHKGKPKARPPWRRTVDGLNAVEKDKTYPEILAAVHGGKSVNPDTLTRVLLAANKTSVDLEADLQRMDRVQELEGIISKASSIQSEIATLNVERSKEIEKEKAERMKMDERHNKTAGEFHQRVNECQGRLRRIGEAQEELERLRQGLSPPEPAERAPQKSEASLPLHLRQFGNVNWHK